MSQLTTGSNKIAPPGSSPGSAPASAASGGEGDATPLMPQGPQAIPADQARSISVVADLKTLTKPRITLMVLITAGIGYALGAHAAAAPWDWVNVLGTFIGTALSCMGASVLNQAYERDTDGMMQRTQNRPLPAGRLRAGPAVVMGLAFSVVGVLVLGLMTTWLAAGISLLTIVSYAGIYTPLKRVTTLALLIGAVPGALPPLIGYAAAAGTLGVGGWLVFTIMYLWQVPHFLAIAWLYREDYAKAGLVMLPVVDPSGGRTFNQIVIGCLMLLPVGLLPTYMGITGLGYFFCALACGLGFLGFGLALVAQPSRKRARALFLASLVYLPVVLFAMLVDMR